MMRRYKRTNGTPKNYIAWAVPIAAIVTVAVIALLYIPSLRIPQNQPAEEQAIPALYIDFEHGNDYERYLSIPNNNDQATSIEKVDGNNELLLYNYGFFVFDFESTAIKPKDLEGTMISFGMVLPQDTWAIVYIGDGVFENGLRMSFQNDGIMKMSSGKFFVRPLHENLTMFVLKTDISVEIKMVSEKTFEIKVNGKGLLSPVSNDKVWEFSAPLAELSRITFSILNAASGRSVYVDNILVVDQKET